MKHILFCSIILLTVAACQTPQPSPAPAMTALAPVSTAITPPVISATTAPTAEPTAVPSAAPATAPAAEPTAAPTESTATPEPTQAPAASDVYVTAEGGLNLRAEASSSATLLRLLPFGTRLTALGQPTAPDATGIAWQNVQTDDGQSGWAAAQYLTNASPEAAAAPSPTPETPGSVPGFTPGYVYVASVGGLNMRAAASVSSSVIAMLADGQRLQTNGLSSGPDSAGITWLNVKTEDNIEGWVAAEFVREQVPSVAPATPPANVSDAVAEILRRTNDLRAQHGLNPYAFDEVLAQLALAHSQYMAQNGITHTGAGGLSAKQRIANAGYGGRPTENIYGGQATIDQAWEYWATDPPHVDNLLNPFNTLVGIGVYQTGLLTYYTMDFAKPPE